MKRFFTLSFLSLSISLCGQNLIPDPSAEDFIECPSNFGDLENWLPNWQSFRGSPDYFNNCSDGLGSNNSLGFQEPRTGAGYLGLFTFSRNLSNAREYFGIELIEPLIIGESYYFTFHVSRAHQSNTYNLATNNIGALFMTDNYLNPEEQNPTLNFSTFNEINLVTDTINWVDISYQFIADSSYQYLAFGNFFDDTLTDTLRIGGETTGEVTSYYYFDDFCLTTSPNGCDFTNSLNYESQTHISLSPNPCKDELFVMYSGTIDKITIYTLQGKLMASFFGNGHYSLKIGISLDAGMYLACIESERKKIIRRFVVTN